MKKQWFTPEEVTTKQLACPLSVGQAEAGRYTYCLSERCLAWVWNPDQVEDAENNVLTVKENEVPEGYVPVGEPFKEKAKDKFKMVNVMKKPTHGRCGMVP